MQNRLCFFGAHKVKFLYDSRGSGSYIAGLNKDVICKCSPLTSIVVLPLSSNQ